MMTTHVMGKKIKNYYVVVNKKNDDGFYYSRPRIDTDIKRDIAWEEICSYETEPQKVIIGGGQYIYISEDEEVRIVKNKFRADLGEWYQYTDKVLEEKDINLKKCEKELEKELRGYNKQMIENDRKAKAYCDLHKLDYEETDYDELLKIIGEDKCDCADDISRILPFDYPLASPLSNTVFRISIDN